MIGNRFMLGKKKSQKTKNITIWLTLKDVISTVFATESDWEWDEITHKYMGNYLYKNVDEDFRSSLFSLAEIRNNTITAR